MQAENAKQLQQMKTIENKLLTLSEKLRKSNMPIFIELVGTPKSGKTT